MVVREDVEKQSLLVNLPVDIWSVQLHVFKYHLNLLISLHLFLKNNPGLPAYLLTCRNICIRKIKTKDKTAGRLQS